METFIEMEKITLHFDGSCEPQNPGGNMGFGVLIKLNGKIIFENTGFAPASPRNTNNVAEYQALVNGLQWLLDNAFSSDQIEVMGDSMLVINQMKKVWRAKGGFYFPTYQKACALRDQFDNISFRWIPRDQNSEADNLSRSQVEQQ